MKKKIKLPSEREFRRFVEDMSRFETPQTRRRRRRRRILFYLVFFSIVAAAVYYWRDIFQVEFGNLVDYWQRYFSF